MVARNPWKMCYVHLQGPGWRRGSGHPPSNVHTCENMHIYAPNVNIYEKGLREKPFPLMRDFYCCFNSSPEPDWDSASHPQEPRPEGLGVLLQGLP